MNKQTSTTEKPCRPYIRHKWIATDRSAYCFVCGISEKTWERKIEKAAMIDWDCQAVRERNH